MWYGADMKSIVQNGDPVLRAEAALVEEAEFGTKALIAEVQDMIDALDAEQDGVALAAPQIGISKRIFIVRYDRLHPAPEGSPVPADIGIFINPEFMRVSRRREVMDEGCLSVRGMYGKTYRHERATVRARTVDGARFERGGGGILAQVFQHEIDHLDGILFIDDAVDTYESSRTTSRESDAQYDEYSHE